MVQAVTKVYGEENATFKEVEMAISCHCLCSVPPRYVLEQLS